MATHDFDAFVHPSALSCGEQCELAADLGFPTWAAEQAVQRWLEALPAADQAGWRADIRAWREQGCAYDDIAGWLPVLDDAAMLDRDLA